MTAKSVNQRRYLEAIDKHDIVFGIGPAGTGKTYLAMAQAVSFLLAKRVSRIILARPAVEAGEKLGFLPGDLQEKVNPYLRPLYDALYDMLEIERAERLLERGTIEVAPIAFMRGRTLNDAFVILDEAQNTTSEQMKMFLTRLGFGSKAVITGDVTQIDLPVGRASGLVEAVKIVGNIEGIAFVHFDDKDVVRHSARPADRQGVRSLRWIPTVAACAVAVTDGRGRPVRAPGPRPRGSRRSRRRGARGDARRSRSSPTPRSVRLNRRFRRKDKPTDVLSFPGRAARPPGSAPTGPRQPGRYRDRHRRGAAPGREAGHSYAAELKVLALHGLLHLLGYDHHAPDDRGRMARLEARLRRKGGLGAGLIERAGASDACGA